MPPSPSQPPPPLCVRDVKRGRERGGREAMSEERYRDGLSSGEET